MMTESELLARLLVLGDTPAAIAHNLRVRNIKGLPNNPFDCPVAVYLLSVGCKRPCVGPMRVIDVDRTDYHHTTVPTPQAIYSFLQYFDANAYPELVAFGGRFG